MNEAGAKFKQETIMHVFLIELRTLHCRVIQTPREGVDFGMEKQSRLFLEGNA
jgi:hypothetical protein